MRRGDSCKGSIKPTPEQLKIRLRRWHTGVCLDLQRLQSTSRLATRFPMYFFIGSSPDLSWWAGQSPSLFY